MDSNHRLSDYEPLALPLSYAAMLETTGRCARVFRAPSRNRTVDLLLTMETLCRLS